MRIHQVVTIVDRVGGAGRHEDGRKNSLRPDALTVLWMIDPYLKTVGADEAFAIKNSRKVAVFDAVERNRYCWRLYELVEANLFLEVTRSAISHRGC
jgi:hypothetical protein